MGMITRILTLEQQKQQLHVSFSEAVHESPNDVIH